MGPLAGWYRLRLLREILDELVPGVEQFLLVNNVVAVEDGAALVPGQEHGDALGDVRADQVARGSAATIVEEAGRHPGRLTGGAPRRAPAANGNAVAVEDQRAAGVAACPPSRQGLGDGGRDGEDASHQRLYPKRSVERPLSERRTMIQSDQPLPVTRRCELLKVARSTAYCRPGPVSHEDLVLMRLIDEIHLELPFYGSRRIRDELETRGHPVNRKRVQRLMRHMGVAALYPKRRTSAPGRDHKVYPYLLTGVSVERANQVWATDICYLPMAKGFMYLVAVMDWLSRRVLSWRVSNTLDREFCVEALEEALARYGAPEIFNTDQGAQFTSEAFTDVLKAHGVAISMDGKGRWIDNVFIERLWRSVKYEDIYLRAYETPAALRAGLTRYFDFYNTRRRHTALDRRTPDAVYFEQVAVNTAA